MTDAIGMNMAGGYTAPLAGSNGMQLDRLQKQLASLEKRQTNLQRIGGNPAQSQTVQQQIMMIQARIAALQSPASPQSADLAPDVASPILGNSVNAYI